MGEAAGEESNNHLVYVYLSEHLSVYQKVIVQDSREVIALLLIPLCWFSSLKKIFCAVQTI